MLCNTTFDLICHLKVDTSASAEEKEKAILKGIHFWFDGVIGLTIASIGLIMNTITILILQSEKDMKNMINNLLSALLITNNVFLITNLVNILVYDFDFKDWTETLPFFFIYPIKKTSLTMVVYFIIALAHQAYVTIWDPAKYKLISSREHYRQKRTRQYVIPIIVVAIIVNLPRWFSYECHRDGNKFKIIKGVLKKSFYYVVFYENFVLNILTVFVPITLLILFNWSIRNFIQEKERQIATRKSLLQDTPPTDTQGNGRGANDRKNSGTQHKTETNILIIIIILFIICHFPRCIIKFFDGFPKSFGSRVMESFERVLLIIHASTTPFIYISKNLQFRQYLFDVLNKICFCRNVSSENSKTGSIQTSKMSTKQKSQSLEMK